MRWPLLGERRRQAREPDLSEVRATSEQLRILARELAEAKERTRLALVRIAQERDQ